MLRKEKGGEEIPQSKIHLNLNSYGKEISFQ